MEMMYDLLNKAAAGKRFNRDDKDIALSLFDDMYSILESRRNPPDFKLASGQKATGATGRIALNAYFLLLGRFTYGKKYTRMDSRLKYWNMNLGYRIMRGYFNGWDIKGFYCCTTCTLSMLPLYCTDAFEDFDCQALKQNVLKELDSETGYFSKNYNKKYADWVLQFVT
ncbi:MAG: hypothetical protein K9N06_11905 [Candidatus Cloacimonetes bacterium]|nr:hypothetical protein [Candidatus Cloacimonadota bacterium]